MDDSARPKLLMVSVKVFEGMDGENLLLWMREVEMAIAFAMVQTEKQRVVLAISNLGGQAREWALTCGTSVEATFPSSAELKLQLSRVFSPSNQAYRVRSRFLAARQGKKELVNFVQEMRTLIARMAANILPEAVTVTIFMEGLRTRVAGTEVFRAHPSLFEGVVNVASNAKFNFKSERLGWNANSNSSLSGPMPMDLSYAWTREESSKLPGSTHSHDGVLSVQTLVTCGTIALALGASRLFEPSHQFLPV
ncbi:Retrotransposon gag domain [Plasmopara halstedii]|uniref:Retrotransposon gag domain n=1 Tax=Plasmopara halstedii TaxID=4781 RepID=A0A0P1A622_PLAHL|nr:Retrotransposon gag domain [Plasmopara halstedii]CEG35989.1 Retrotransposon gag domain [Plasmopara halstedii]|eukprot:XP_024572358.1 Retrotransposon gag domain [Plasmopara halstedii]